MGSVAPAMKYGLPAHFIAAPDENGCERWLGHIDRDGYGKSGRYYASRLTYAFAHGEIPVGLQIDHLCHVHDCVNPDPAHLQVATNKENGENRAGPPLGNTSGVMGVSWHVGRWRVQVKHHGKTYSGGRYDDIGDAEQAAIALRNRLFTNNLKDRP